MAGVHFLMETAAMVDQIVNTTALSFVLTTDELILERLATKATRHIMEVLEDHQLFDHTPFENETQEISMKRYREWEMNWWSNGHKFPLVPMRLCWTTLLMASFTAEYYFHNCRLTADGSYVSKDVSLPDNAHLNMGIFISKFFSLPDVENPDTTFWSWEAVTG